MIYSDWKIGDTALVADYTLADATVAVSRTRPVKVVAWTGNDTDGRNHCCVVEHTDGRREAVHFVRLSRIEEGLRTAIEGLMSQYGWSAVAAEVGRYAPK